MSVLNVKIDRFTGRRNSFSLWQIKMRALLKQQGLWAPLSKKASDPETAEMISLEEKAHSTIMLCLADDIITEVAEEETTSGSMPYFPGQNLRRRSHLLWYIWFCALFLGQNPRRRSHLALL